MDLDRMISIVLLIPTVTHFHHTHVKKTNQTQKEFPKTQTIICYYNNNNGVVQVSQNPYQKPIKIKVFSHFSHRHSHKPPHNHTPILPSLSPSLSFAFNPIFQMGHNPILWSAFSLFSSVETLSIRHSSLPPRKRCRFPP